MSQDNRQLIYVEGYTDPSRFYLTVLRSGKDTPPTASIAVAAVGQPDAADSIISQLRDETLRGQVEQMILAETMMLNADWYVGAIKLEQAEQGTLVSRPFKRGKYEGTTYIFGRDLKEIQHKYEQHISSVHYYSEG